MMQGMPEDIHENAKHDAIWQRALMSNVCLLCTRTCTVELRESTAIFYCPACAPYGISRPALVRLAGLGAAHRQLLRQFVHHAYLTSALLVINVGADNGFRLVRTTPPFATSP